MGAANYGAEIGKDLRAEAHQFRQLDRNDYDNKDGFASCEKCFGEAKERDVKSGIQTILAVSKQDNEEKYQQIVDKYIAAASVTIVADEFECFTDYSKMLNKQVTLATVESWAAKTITTIIGKKQLYLLKHMEGDIRDGRVHNINYILVTGRDLKEMCKKEVKCPNPRYGEPKQPQWLDSLADVVDDLIKKERAIPRFNGIDFYPFNKTAIASSIRFNLFNGFEMQSYVPEQKFDFEKSAWYRHLWTDFCKEDKEDPGLFKALMREIAYTIQEPGRKTDKFCVLVGAMGTGKTMFAEWMRDMLGEQYCHLFDKATDLFAGFNAVQERKIFMFVEELGEQAELNKHSEQFKAMVTADKRTITYKGIDSFQVINTMHLWAGTNNDKFAHMPGEERRTFAMKVSDAHANNKEYFKPIIAELKDRDYIKACFDYFSNYDLSGYNPKEVFVTKFKRQRQADDKPLPLKHIEWLFTRGEGDLKEHVQFVDDMHKSFLGWAATEEVVTTKLTKSAYQRLMIEYGFIMVKDKRIGEQRRHAFTITRDQAETIIGKKTNNPSYKLE